MVNMEKNSLSSIKTLGSIKNKIVVSIIIIFVSIACGSIISLYIIKPSYESKISFIVGKLGTEQNAKVIDNNNVLAYQNLTKTYVEIAKSYTLAEETAKLMSDSYKPDDVLDSVSVNLQGSTQVIYVDIRQSEAEKAFTLANKYTEALLNTISKNQFDNMEIRLLDKPRLQNKPIQPSKILVILISLLIGIVLSMVYIIGVSGICVKKPIISDVARSEMF